MKFIITLLLFFSFLYSTSLKEEQIKGMYIYNFAKNIIWNSKIENYNFHIISKNEYLNNFFKELIKVKKLNNSSIEVTFGELKSNEKPQVIFIDNDSIDEYESIFEKYQGQKVLLVSDRFDNQRKVMINLLATTNGKIHFEINRANILNQGLSISPDMILLGGSEIDVAKLYKKSQDLLTKEEKKNLKLQSDIKFAQIKVNKLKNQINSQNNTIKEQLQEIEKRKKEIDKQKSKIDKQNSLLNKQLKEIETQKRNIKEQKSDIDEQKEAIRKQNMLLKELSENIKTQKENMLKQKELLNELKDEQIKQNSEIEKRNEILQNLNSMIDEQKIILVKKDKTITTQESTIFTLALLIGIIIVLIIFVLISYKKLSSAKIQIEKQTKDLKEAKSELEEVHKQLTDSIKYASLIQGTLIPERVLFEKYFNDSFVIWEPRDVVGGDIYLFEELTNDRGCILMVIDCTGHGVAGAFVTMLVKAIERQIVSEIEIENEDISPSKILSIFNKNIKNLLKQEDKDSISNAGFDGGIIYYNKREKIIKFAGAETPLFIIQNDKLEMIKGDRHSIGYKKSQIDYEFKEHTIDVSKNSIIYLTTDGYLDQTGGEKNFMFGKKRFKKLLEKNYQKSFSEQREILIKEFYDYMGNRDKKDDLTIIGLKI